jgi:hypothetical protein
MIVFPLRRSVGFKAAMALSRVETLPMFVRSRPSRTRRTRAAAGIGLELLSGRRVCRRVRVPRAAWILDRIRSYRSSARVVKTIEGANRGPAPRISRMPDSAVRGSSTFNPPVVDRPLQRRATAYVVGSGRPRFIGHHKNHPGTVFATSPRGCRSRRINPGWTAS